MKQKKKVILVLTGVLVMCLVTFGITYSYFQGMVGSPAQTDINVISNTVDSLVFDVSNSIGFSADQDSFGQGMGNASGSTVAKATLIANNKTNSATDYYNLYLNIGYNDFVYSKDTDTPELLLVVKDSDGNLIRDIEGLDFVTVLDGKNKNVSGYDITTLNGVVTLYLNKEIVAEPLKEESYTIEIVFVNYDFNQALNAGKKFIGDVIITQEVVAYKLGDVNGDDDVNYIDSMYINEFLNGQQEMSFNQTLSADVNFDNIIDYNDVYLILYRYIPWISARMYNIIYDLNGGVKNGALVERYDPDLALLMYQTGDNGVVNGYTIFNAVKKDNYKFTGWTCEEIGLSVPTKTIYLKDYGDLHLVANWEPES